MNENFRKLKDLLTELFQLDAADLDFGIYRIMNQKRDEIVRFLEHDLLPQVRETLQASQSGDVAALQAELDRAIVSARGLGVDPETTQKVKDLRAQMAQADITGLENEVFSHLTNFFRRYYSEGDFISLRRYKSGVYAIPYEGEEVKLHWANADQYYIKTSEYFRDYTFTLPSGKRAHFRIAEADTERDNNLSQNGNERRFILCAESPLLEENGEIIIRFEYRQDDAKRKQTELSAAAVQAIITTTGFTEWQRELASLSPTENNPRRTLLEKHLTGYTARNTFDYFIHKDLHSFLHRELDFFIKNEVVRLDDIKEETAPRVEQYLAKVKALRRIGHKIIAFLAQLEDFQKKLWLKKKFVVETNYCVTLDRVPEELYPEITTNTEQVEEWKRLFVIEEIPRSLENPGYSDQLTVDFLKANRSLVLDTRFFSKEFVNRVLVSIEDVDEQTDGMLICSENYQALSLISSRYNGKIKCIHIDPPYNTATSGFLYKNAYQHSSWLSMMENRLQIGCSLLTQDGDCICHIDENEYENLHLLFNSFNYPDAGTIIWDKRNPMNAGRGIANQHEYIIWRSKQASPIYIRNGNVRSMLKAASDFILQYNGVIEGARKAYAAWVDRNPLLSGGEKAYRYIDDEGKIFQSVSLRAPEPRTDPKFFQPLLHPITGKPCAIPPNGFSRTPETLQGMVDRGEILFGPDETTQPRQKVILTEASKRQLSSVIQDARKGKADISILGLEFPYCHPVSLYNLLIGASAHGRSDVICDFFAGSGTTGVAVIDLNRDDLGSRKYILIEMGDHIDTVLKPRIMKVIYSTDWKDGKPVVREGSSHIFKYIRLESFEDTLNNLALRRTPEQGQLLEMNPQMREEYMLQYVLDVESHGSASLLNITAFEDPFNYKLNIGSGSVGETKPTIVDLVETFNYLLGLRVKHVDTIRGFRVVQGTNPRGERVLVIWRNVKEQSSADLEEFFLKQGYNTQDMEFDLIYVNGDNHLENLRREDETWKVRLIDEEFQRLMFDVEDI